MFRIKQAPFLLALLLVGCNTTTSTEVATESISTGIPVDIETTVQSEAPSDVSTVPSYESEAEETLSLEMEHFKNHFNTLEVHGTETAIPCRLNELSEYGIGVTADLEGRTLDGNEAEVVLYYAPSELRSVYVNPSQSEVYKIGVVTLDIPTPFELDTIDNSYITSITLSREDISQIESLIDNITFYDDLTFASFEEEIGDVLTLQVEYTADNKIFSNSFDTDGTQRLSIELKDYKVDTITIKNSKGFE